MILVVGETLVDVVERADGSRAEHAGGSPANVAVGLGRLGLDVELSTTIGDDAHGTLLREHLAAAGVSLTPGVATPDRTSTAHARLDAGGAATYAFDVTWDPGTLVPSRAPDVVHTGSLAAVVEPGAAQVGVLLRRSAPTSIVTFDPNVRPDVTPDRAAALARVEELVALADVVKVSDEDLRWLVPDADPHDVALAWLGAGPAAVVVTAGAEGSRTLTAHGAVDVPAMAGTVADTVGAGDAFMSGLLAALVREGVAGPGGSAGLRSVDADLWRRVSEVAARSAAVAVSREGAQPPWPDELFGS